MIDGLRYGVVRVAEYSRVPSICKAIGNDETNRAIVRPGYIYRRSDAMECAPVDSAGGVQAIIEAAVAKTGAAVRAMVQGSPTPPRVHTHAIGKASFLGLDSPTRSGNASAL